MQASFIFRRLVLAVPTLFLVAVIVFVVMRVVPGDPIAMMVPPGASQADIENLRRLYGFDRSIGAQFLIWLGDLVRGDLGRSISLRTDVLALVLSRLPATLELVLVAMAAAVAAGGGLAVLAVWLRGTWIEAAVDGVVGFVLAIPDFLWALVMILAFGVAWKVLPIQGRIDPRLPVDLATNFYLIESLVTGRFRLLASLASHVVLPAAALALPLAAVIGRVLKSSLAEAMTQDYVQMARVKGFTRGRIILREALKNAAIPTLTLSGVQFTFLLGGTVLVEKIFGYPGIGIMAIDAVINRDLPLIQGVVLTFAVLFILVNLAIDLAVTWLNPRLRRG